MRILAVDHGRKRIGFAISDDTATIATPLPQLTVDRGHGPVALTVDVVEKQQPELVLVGIPLGLDGKPTQQSVLVQKYIEQLKSRTDIPIKLWNESYSSKEAQINAKLKRSANIDSESARIILQEYLDFSRTGI